MKARDKTIQFEAKSDHAMSDEVLFEKQRHEMAAASERFATMLRTASVETQITGPRALSTAQFIRGELLLWTAPSQSDWRRYAGRIVPSTIH
jgi:hypothetical protein